MAVDAGKQPLTFSDAALMQRVAAGDREALAQLVAAHQDRVWRIAWHFTHHHADAQDLTQETFLRLWQGAASYRPTAALSTWLYRIIANLCIDRRRRQQARPVPVDAASLDGMPAAGGGDAVAAGEVQQQVAAALQMLPERQRLAIVLHRYEGLSYAEIAAHTGWSVSAVESLVVRGYATLRERLRDLAED